MSRRAEFEAEHPEVHVLSADQAGRVDLVMGAVGWLGDEEQVTTCASLNGESSTVIRVELQELRGGWRTAVLKQSLPWLRRDEAVAMPADRARVELRFYRQVARLPDAAARMPRLLGGDERRSLLLLEDFRGASDLTSLYRGGPFGVDVAEALGSFLEALHRGTRGGHHAELAETGMKALNHRLLFEAPLGLSAAGGNGFGPDGPPLDRSALEEIEPGLGAAAAALRSDRALRDAVAELGRRYREGGSCLVHGSFHPGNWLLLPGGEVRVVDPQYGGWGDAEFDIGTGLAHLLLAGQSDEIITAFVAGAVGPQEAVEQPADSGEPGAGVDRDPQEAPSEAPANEFGRASADTRMQLIARYAGAELVRRLMGGGQLPLSAGGGTRCALLDAARMAIVEGRMEVLET